MILEASFEELQGGHAFGGGPIVRHHWQMHCDEHSIGHGRIGFQISHSIGYEVDLGERCQSNQFPVDGRISRGEFLGYKCSDLWIIAPFGSADMQGDLHRAQKIQKVRIADKALRYTHQVVHHLSAGRRIAIAVDQSQRRLNHDFAVAFGQEVTPLIGWNIHEQATA